MGEYRCSYSSCNNSRIILLPSFIESEKFEIKPATDFTVTDVNGIEFSLSDYKGNVTILHFSGLENPLCTECLEEMKGQIVGT